MNNESVLNGFPWSADARPWDGGWAVHPQRGLITVLRAFGSREGGRMGNLLFWLGIGAAQKGAGSKPIERRHWVASLIVGILIALLIAVGMFFLLVSQQ
jgi:hypothetical protein